jgi:hypothetical protein
LPDQSPLSTLVSKADISKVDVFPAIVTRISHQNVSKMPYEEHVRWSFRIIKKSSVEMLSGNTLSVMSEVYDLVVVLN